MLSGVGVLFYCIAPTKRHYQCAETALNCGADCNNATRQGTPILTFACETAKSNEDLCLALLDAGADPTVADQVALATSSLYCRLVFIVHFSDDIRRNCIITSF